MIIETNYAHQLNPTTPKYVGFVKINNKVFVSYEDSKTLIIKRLLLEVFGSK